MEAELPGVLHLQLTHLHLISCFTLDGPAEIVAQPLPNGNTRYRGFSPRLRPADVSGVIQLVRLCPQLHFLGLNCRLPPEWDGGQQPPAPLPAAGADGALALTPDAYGLVDALDEACPDLFMLEVSADRCGQPADWSDQDLVCAGLSEEVVQEVLVNRQQLPRLRVLGCCDHQEGGFLGPANSWFEPDDAELEEVRPDLHVVDILEGSMVRPLDLSSPRLQGLLQAEVCHQLEPRLRVSPSSLLPDDCFLHVIYHAHVRALAVLAQTCWTCRELALKFLDYDFTQHREWLFEALYQPSTAVLLTQSVEARFDAMDTE